MLKDVSSKAKDSSFCHFKRYKNFDNFCVTYMQNVVLIMRQYVKQNCVPRLRILHDLRIAAAIASVIRVINSPRWSRQMYKLIRSACLGSI